MKRLVRPAVRSNDVFSSHDFRGKHRRIYSAEGDENLEEDVNSDEVDDETDDEFGDKDDTNLSGDVEADFEKIVKQLRDTSYEELGDALEEIVNDPKLYTLLSEGFGSGDLAKVKMSTSTTAIPVSQLLPSQSEIGLDNSLAYPLKQDCSYLFNSPVTVVSPILTYRKTFLIDGHHRWSQIYMINPKAKATAINFNYQESSPYRALRNFQGAIAVANKDVPKSYSKVNNVYDMSEDAIRSYVDSNIKDVCWKSLVKQGVCEDRESAIEYIVGNAMALKSDNPPFAGAPEREYMPQTNEKSIKIAKQGQTNI